MLLRQCLLFSLWEMQVLKSASPLTVSQENGRCRFELFSP